MTVAPKASACSILAGSRSAGMQTNARSPRAAAARAAVSTAETVEEGFGGAVEGGGCVRCRSDVGRHRSAPDRVEVSSDAETRRPFPEEGSREILISQEDLPGFGTLPASPSVGCRA